MKGKAMKVIVNKVDAAYDAWIENALEAALAFEGVEKDCEVEVILCSLDEIHELNLEQRGVDRPTDVLSFPMEESLEEAESDPATGAIFLGSMALCVDKAKAQAEEYGHSLKREVSFLVVHSLLHLLGYDHELGEAEEKEMFARQEEILERMGILR